MLKQTIIYLALIILLTAGLIYENNQVNILRSRLRIIDTLYVSRVITDTIKVEVKERKTANVRRSTVANSFQQTPETAGGKVDSTAVVYFDYQDRRLRINGFTRFLHDSSAYSLNYTLFPDTISSVLHYRNNEILNTVELNGKEYQAETKADYFSELTKAEKPAFWDNIYTGFMAGVILTTAIYYTARGR